MNIGKRTSEKALLMGLYWIVFSLTQASAADKFFSHSDSECGPAGLFCLHFHTETNNHVCLFKVENGKIKSLFTNQIQGGIQPPMCFSNSVIVVKASGVIRKFALSGNLLFEKVPVGFKGACWGSGRLGLTHIFMTETIISDATVPPKYRLHLVDVSGSVPTIEKSFDIVQPVFVSCTLDEIVVSSEADTVRIKLPAGLSD